MLRVPDPQAAKRSMASAYQGAIEAVTAMVFCALAGWWIDGRLDSGPIGLFLGMGIGFAAFLLRLLRIKAPTLGRANLPPAPASEREEDEEDGGADWPRALTPHRDDEDDDEGSGRK
jgi:F0F1-type ATP synthase assembly protein I